MSGDIPLGDTYRVFKDEAEQAFARIRLLAGGMEVETSILEGRPAAEMVKFAAKKKIDLIVIGTQGKKDWSASCLGAWQKKSYVQLPARCL